MSKKAFNKEEEMKIIKEYQNGATSTELGKKYSVNGSTILTILKSNGIVIKNKNLISEEESINIINDFHSGMNTVQLGKKYNRNNTTIGRHLKKNKLSARNIKSKLTKEKIDEAYSLYLTKEYNTITLGEKYNVSERTIANSFEKYGYKLRSSGHVSQLENHNYFEEIDTEAKAYYLGFIMADGSIVKDKNNLRLSIEIHTQDTLLLEKLAKELSLPKNRVSQYSRVNYNGTEVNTCKLYINSNKLCEDLISHGVKIQKRGNKMLPLNVPKSLMNHCIRGLYDGDGNVDYNKKIIRLFGGGSMTLDVKEYLEDNIELNKSMLISNYEDKCPVLTSRFVNNFNHIINFLYKNATIYLLRKHPSTHNYVMEIAPTSSNIG